MKKLTVVVPVKNEAKNVTPLVRRIHSALKKARIDYDIVVVDDHSTDNTFEILQNLSKKYPLFVYQKDGKPGKAYSILEGARRTNSEFIAMIDGDLQYPPELLPQMYNLAVIHGVSVGNRTKRHTNFIRQFASKAYRFAFGKLLMGMDTDVQSGIKVFRREIITHIREADVTPWTLDMPLLHTARELGYATASVDMEFLERANGQSNVKVLRASCEIGLRALNLRFSKRRIYQIEPEDDTMRGSGLAYKKKRYITHTKLSHHESALRTTTTAQKVAIFVVVLAILAGVIINPFATALAFTAALSFIYFVDVLFSSFVLLKSLHFPPELVVSSEKLNEIKDRSLPVYSVLCPLYKEAHILPQFVEAMEELDWPKDKLEVLLLLEEDDTKTIDAAKAMKLPSHFKIVVVPHSLPKSKPKACNYGLSVATGEYVVIYDAEDKPDPLQLKKVYLSFLKLGKKYGCIQCKLNYFNSTDNLLTRLFTAEYSLWFDVILPGLQSIEGIIPLGGTSNHFRRADLLSLNAWDPFNVTEDADLGMRLFKRGYKTAIVDSTTLDEANSRVWNWIRQRSRWIKGYFQTYLVHMRNPIDLFRTFGVQALVFQLVIGMRMTFMLINPLLWLITISYFAAYKIVGPTIESLFPPLVFYMAGFALIIGNFMYIYNYMIGCAKRGHWGLIKFVFLIPLYWLITSFAAAMALWQLITKPHYWEKTNHGLQVGAKTLVTESLLASDSLSPLRRRKYAKYLNKASLSGAFLIFASFAGNFFNFLYNAYLGRQLSPEVFGVIGLIGSFLSISQIITSGLGKTVTYKSAHLLGKHSRTIKEFWARTNTKWVWISFAIALVWILLTPVLMHVFKSQDPLPFVLFAPVWVIGILAAIDSGFLSGNLRFGVIALASIVEAILKFVFAYLFVSFNKSDLVYAAVPLSMFCSFSIYRLTVYLMKAKDIAEESKSDLSFPKKFFATSIFAKISAVAFLSLDVLLAKLFLSPRDAGLYTLLSLIGSIVYFTGTLFSQFITPLVSRAEGSGKNSDKVFKYLILATALASISAFIVFGVFGNTFTVLLFGSRTLPVVPFLAIYTGAMVATTIALNIVSYHQIKNHYLFPIVSFLVSLLQIVGIYKFHNNLVQVISIVVIINIVHLLIISLLSIFYRSIALASKNIFDFFGLFTKIPGENKKSSEKNLKILVFNWRDTKHINAGGAEIYMQEIAKRWVREGNQVTIFCGNDGKSKRHEVIDGVRIVRRGGFYMVYVWAFLYYIVRFRNEFDIVVDNENGIPFFTPLYVKVPTILLIHHIHKGILLKELHLKKRLLPIALITQQLESKFMPFAYRNCSIVTVSKSSKKDIEKLNCRGEINIINPGVDLETFYKSKKSKTPTFIYLGRLKAYKNIDIAIKAFSKVVAKYDNAKFLIVGEGEESIFLKQLVEGLGLGGKVIFTGRVDHEEKVRLLSKAWVSIQPSSFEGWGITVIESNACGTPVIASNTNGLKDSVIDGKTGILVPAKNTDILSREMLEIVKDTEFRKLLSKNAYEWAQHFSWEVSSSNFYNLLEMQVDRINVSNVFAKEGI